MRKPKLSDYLLLILLALIWAPAFFNIKIATYSFGPITIAFLRVFFGAIPVLLLCYFKKIKIEAFSKDWYWFAIIGFINLVAPFFLIAYGVQSVQSNLAAILMSTTPLSSTVLGHFYTKNEKFNFSVGGETNFVVEYAEINGFGGIATSGWKGRSFSMGIADSVTVIAGKASIADAAATIICNHIDLDNSKKVKKTFFFKQKTMFF